MWAQIAEKMHDATMDYASLASNLYNSKFQRQNARKALQHQIAYDKNGIQWRVNDAIQAGLHPLYALGANAQSAVQNMFSPNDFQAPSKGQLMDLSQFSSLATEQARLSNENLRLQNEKLKLQNQAYELEKNKTSSRASASSKSLKNPPTGFDNSVQNLFSFSVLGSGDKRRIIINPSDNINVDDLGTFFAYPRFFSDKWSLNSYGVDIALDYLNDSRSPYGKMLAPNERWVRNWSWSTGNEFVIHKFNPSNAFKKSVNFINYVKRGYQNRSYDYENMSYD